MGATPDQLRGDIDARRAHLAHNVDRLADRVTPSRVAHRQADAAHRKMTDMKERVMGTAQDAGASTHRAAAAVGDTAERLADTTRDTAAQIGDAVQQAPAQLRKQTKGSPMAAGIMAFGAGLLAAALLPTSEVEEQGGAKLREHAELLEPAKQAAVEAVQDVREELREPAADAVQAVKDSAQDATDTTTDAVQDAGQRTARDLKATGQDAAREVQQSRT
ncbi:hypothetical protein GCM10018781_80540 [Kitasatospora indigofera]|uniref:DUF3618 domain-containing protein n=1 Tax=Kitasatospora indigofera TaxID=67307 RepID=A0A918YXA7_9ACTN|nr:DUF3618 domain-containing protein [Kitasatospora indigofera]GHE27951.1 hypothetical protein GCM10018781_80540 [Kitasatospora indigofera]